MPTTCLDIIKRAMKKLHVLPSETEPNAAQAFDGMALLQGLIFELIGQGSLGRLRDVLATADYTAKEWERVRYDSGSVTITLPDTITANDNPTYDYGFTDDVCDYGAGFSEYPRPPLNLAPIVLVNIATDGMPKYHIYNAYTGAWVAINDLAEQDAFPFPHHLENGISCLLAEAWADDWDQQCGPETKRQAAACRLMLATKPDSHHRNTSSHSQFM
jgi:hypothetical protein